MYKSLLFIILINNLLLSNNTFGQRKHTQSAFDKDVLIQKENKIIKSVKSISRNTVGNAFVNFSENEYSIVGGISFSKQVIESNEYSSDFNYFLNDLNKIVTKPGYYCGIRLDGLYNKKVPYSFIFTLNKLSTSTIYKNKKNISPIIGQFSNFKGEDQFFTFKVASHLKKTLPIFQSEKYKLLIVAGPSVDIRLSQASIDNEVSKAYHKVFINGDIGLEYNYQKKCLFFFHYQQGIASITKKPIKTNLNCFELGLTVKASELF